jgi:ABC-2 type transport system permease protein
MKKSTNGFRKIVHIAWREIRYTALTPAFLLGVVGVPIAMLGLVVLYPLLLSQESRPLEGTLAVVDPSGRIGAQVAIILEEDRLEDMAEQKLKETLGNLPLDSPLQNAGGGTSLFRMNIHLFKTEIDLEILEVRDPQELPRLKDRLQAGELVGIAVIPEELLDLSADIDALPEDEELLARYDSFELFLTQDSAPNQTNALEDILKQAVVEIRAEVGDIDYDTVQRILTRPRVRAIRVSESGENPENIKIRMILPIVLMMLLWVSTITSGNYILTSTIEEKSNRVMEVLLSAVSPMQLMTGKLLGQSVVASFMMVMYGGMAILGLFAIAMADLISMGLIVLSLCYFAIAYFMVASIMAAIGSAVNDLRDAQSLMGPAMIILILPMILWMPITNNPESPLAVITGFIPPLIPFVMILRIASSSEAIPLWQIVLSLTLGGLSVVAMLWMCARIFRVGVLMQGKPPSPLELLRWMRYR